MKHPYLAKLLFLLLLAGLGFSTRAQAQTGSISGKVLDGKGAGIPGATVLIEGTTLGSSSNVDGTFNITNVPVGPRTLAISFVGYTSSRIPVTVVAGQNVSADATLGENTTQLAEAVVVGYGTQRRQDVTGSIEQISEKQFVKGQVTSPEQLVQGKVAGVQITTGSGAPGAASQILIRGGSSLNASNQPLIVIDGVPVDNTGIAGASNPLSLINPNDIENITVLKDASSTAIYGSRASNGVIIVTTKRGIAGDKTHVTFSTLLSAATPAKYVPVLTGDQFRDYVNKNGNDSQKATLGTANTDWQKEIYRTAITSDNNLSLTGSAANTPFRVSAGYLNQQGLLINNKLDRYSGALSVTPILLDGNLRIDLNVKGSVIKNNFSGQSAVNSAVYFDPTQPVTSDLARYQPYGGYFEFLDAGANNTFALNQKTPVRNPLSLIKQRNDISTVKRSIGNLQVDYKLPFLSGLSANVNLGYDIQRGNGSLAVPATAASDFTRKGISREYKQNLDNVLLEEYAKYAHQFSEKIRFDILAGHSWQRFRNTQFNMNDYQGDGTTLFQTAAKLYDGQTQYTDTYVLESYYSRANVNIADRYLLTATIRADGTSRFGPGNKWGYFPSVGAAWRLKGEQFLANSTTISDLKLRVGYGQTGQQDLGIGNLYNYLSLSSLSTNTAQYPLGVDATGKPVYYNTLRANFSNSNLKWETTSTINLGLDYGFFGGRLYGSVDVYQRNTTDLLNNVFVPAGSNQSNAGLLNVGSLENRGIELVANIDVVRGEKFNLSVNANATMNRNKLTKLTNSDNPNSVGSLTGGISNFDGVGNQTIQVNTVGYASQSFYVYQQVYDANGKPVEGVFVDRNGDGVINSHDQYRYKSGRPQAVLGFGANMSYGHASLAFTMRSNIGNYVYNNQRARSLFVQNSNGFVRNVTSEVLNTNFVQNQERNYLSDYFIENGSFLRMENVTLGYSFGDLVKKGTTLNLSLAAQNLFLITKYKGLDPELVDTNNGTLGIDQTIYPRPRTFTAGLSLGF